MKKRIASLITVKSIITILLSIVFSVLTLRGNIEPEQFTAVYTLLIGALLRNKKSEDTDTNNN